MPTIKASEFVKRQTRTSDYSYSTLSWEEIEKITTVYFWTDQTEGYRDGVVLINIPTPGFFSSVVPVTKDLEFETIYEARREGEEPVKKSVTYGTKVPAKRVDIVLYRKDVLEEDELDRDKLTGAEWEIVSVNCSPTNSETPMGPTTMARNILACTDHPFGKGGSCDKDRTVIELAESIAFWNQHTTIREK
jgi:hypothetical protein